MSARRCAVAIVLALIAPPTIVADNFGASNPLPAMLFTLDPASPTLPDIPGASASDVLRHPGPTIAIPGASLGLTGHPLDVLDGISFANAGIGMSTQFVLRFSVSRGTIGSADPDPGLVGDGFLFNARQQGTLNQEAADEFMSLRKFTKSGIVPIAAAGVPANNNTLTRNQGDAGGTDYSCKPPTSPDAANAGTQDNINGGASEPVGAVGIGLPDALFFSLSSGSPSLLGLPGTGSGADIFVDLNPLAPGGEVLYVSAGGLGLQIGDDISAFVVLENGDNEFNAGDVILFSLAQGSPSLVPPMTPADVFRNDPGGPVIFAEAAELGLADADSIDALEIGACSDLEVCVQERAIGIVSTVPATSSIGKVLLAAAVAFIGALLIRALGRRPVRV